MNMSEDLHIGVIGLGYVGMPLALVFAERYPVVGYDCNRRRVADLSKATDATMEVDGEKLMQAVKSGRLSLTDKAKDLGRCNVYIVAVPTPVDDNNRPDLAPLLAASRTVGSVLKKGDLVVFESTVYPGVTEEVCVPALSESSGLQYNVDFHVGYSPERVNPGDKEHTVESICKVTSGSTPEAAEFVDRLYGSVLKGGTYRAASIRVAEASKIVENCQRDVNIAFMNELAKIFGAMEIDTGDVLDAAASKWNFIRMKPGLVGGHCIGVDPYYMIEKAQVYGVLPRVMYNARRLNDGMGNYVATQLIHYMNKAGVTVKDARILILGFAFKENCPDTRNTKVVDIYHTLRQYTDRITIVDPWVDTIHAKNEYNINIEKELPDDGQRFDAALLAVAHSQFSGIDIRKHVPLPGIVYDIKGFLPRSHVNARL